MMIELSTLKTLGDAELESALKGLLAASARTEACVVMHLAELDRRRLHLRTGFPSLFRYCMQTLGFSEFEAVFRIAAARLGQKFPLIFELLERRQIHLSALHLLRHHLTQQNHRELLAEACHKSKRQVELLLAHRFPHADVRPSLRELRRLEPLAPGRYRLELTIDEQTKQDLERACELLSHVSAVADFALVVQRGARAVVEQLEKKRYGKRAASGRKQVSSMRRDRANQNAGHRANADEGPVPTGREQGHVMLPANESGRRRVDEGEASGVVQRDVTVGATLPKSDGLRAKSTEQRSELQSPRRARKRIPSHVRRAVAERDDGCCTFVSGEGRRCRSRQLLQIHHEQPWARGGADTPDNLRLLCAEHNRLLAERDFGAEHIERAREQRLASASAATEGVAAGDRGARSIEKANEVCAEGVDASVDARHSDVSDPDRLSVAEIVAPWLNVASIGRSVRVRPPCPDKVARFARLVEARHEVHANGRPLLHAKLALSTA
jgi:5-methylcytosine-specific restriction endonuclease McrA